MRGVAAKTIKHGALVKIVRYDADDDTFTIVVFNSPGDEFTAKGVSREFMTELLAESRKVAMQ